MPSFPMNHSSFLFYDYIGNVTVQCKKKKNFFLHCPYKNMRPLRNYSKTENLMYTKTLALSLTIQFQKKGIKNKIVRLHYLHYQLQHEPF